MCVIERDGKVIIIDQAKRIAELEAEVKRLSEPNACDDWGNPVVLGVSGGSNGKL